MVNSNLSIFCFNYVHSFYHTKHSYHATESIRGCSQKPTPAWCTTLWSIISIVVSSVKCTLVVIFNILFSIWYKSHHSSWMPVTTISCFRVCGRFFKPETQNGKKTQTGENGKENSNWNYFLLVPSRFRLANIRRRNKRIRRP